jgi:hypothetical protein
VEGAWGVTPPLLSELFYETTPVLLKILFCLKKKTEKEVFFLGYVAI